MSAEPDDTGGGVAKRRPETLSSVFRSIGDAIVITDVDGRVVYLNGTAELLVGRDLPSARGMALAQVLPLSEDREGKQPVTIAPGVRRTTERRQHPREAFLHTHSDGEQLVTYEASPLGDNAGAPQGVLVAFNAVPDRTLNQSLSRERLEIIGRATNDAVWDWNLLNDTVWWSDAMCDLFGHAASDVGTASQWWFDHINPSEREAYVEALWKHIRSGETYWDAEYQFQRADSSYAYVFERGYTIRNRNGDPVRMIGAMMDVTARRGAQDELMKLNAELETLVQERTQQLEEANEELELVNKELEAFSYSVSHDLRSPVRSILGRAMMLKEDEGDKLGREGKEHLEAVSAAAKRMEALIEDLLSYSRLARRELVKSEVDLTALAEGVASELAKTGIGAKCQFEIEPGMKTQADPGLLRVVLENLLDNACKYSSRSESPSIRVGMTDAMQAPAFFVRDNGVGFKPEYRARLFQPFERLNSEFPGTGIGLANVQRIVHRHGGHIWAEGEEGKGATFTFTLSPSVKSASTSYVA